MKSEPKIQRKLIVSAGRRTAVLSVEYRLSIGSWHSQQQLAFLLIFFSGFRNTKDLSEKATLASIRFLRSNFLHERAIEPSERD